MGVHLLLLRFHHHARRVHQPHAACHAPDGMSCRPRTAGGLAEPGSATRFPQAAGGGLLDEHVAFPGHIAAAMRSKLEADAPRAVVAITWNLPLRRAGDAERHVVQMAAPVTEGSPPLEAAGCVSYFVAVLTPPLDSTTSG
jgi:hypothetical protein